MASSKDDNKNTPSQTETGHGQTELPNSKLATKRGTLPDRYDLDKNPVLYKQGDGSMSPKAHDKDYMELVLRSGNHSDLVQKILRQKIEARAQDWPRWPADQAGGVRVMWIESRYWYDRERLADHFDDDWRRYRSRYLTSLELHPNEPDYYNVEYHNDMINPIRRAYMKGGDWFEKHFIRRFTNDRFKASFWRSSLIRPWFAYFLAAAFYYRLKYCRQTWEVEHGQQLLLGKQSYYPQMLEDWPPKETRTNPWHFYEEGFLSRNFRKDLRDHPDDTVIL